MTQALHVLCMSTPVGALGSGLGGGVELTLTNLGQELASRGHRLTVIAPQDSVVPGLAVVQVAGRPQPIAQNQGRSDPIVLTADGVLPRMWTEVRQHLTPQTLILNFAYDWLPFYLTPFLPCPVAHLVSMGSLQDHMDRAIADVLASYPGSVAVHSRAQAATFCFGDQLRVIGNGFELADYQFQAEAEPALAWVGRIAPEKGLEDAVAAAQAAGRPLRVMGKLQDAQYWAWVRATFPTASVDYLGFLPTAELQNQLGRCAALLQTPHWVEAFGNVAVEALACGVPVIAYDRGGPAEIVRHGETGWLVPPGDGLGLVAAIHKLNQIDRYRCRQQAEAEFSRAAFGDRVEAWLEQIWLTHK